MQLFCLVTAYTVANLVSAPTNAIAGFVVGESLNLESVAIGVLGGAFVQAVGSILWRTSNLSARNLEINALIHGAPIPALAWLALGSKIDPPPTGQLIIAAVGIIAANLLTNIKAKTSRTARQTPGNGATETPPDSGEQEQ